MAACQYAYTVPRDPGCVLSSLLSRICITGAPVLGVTRSGGGAETSCCSETRFTYGICDGKMITDIFHLVAVLSLGIQHYLERLLILCCVVT